MKAVVKYAPGPGHIDVYRRDLAADDEHVRPGTRELHDLVTASLPITEWSRAFDLCRDKVVLDPQGRQTRR